MILTLVTATGEIDNAAIAHRAAYLAAMFKTDALAIGFDLARRQADMELGIWHREQHVRAQTKCLDDRAAEIAAEHSYDENALRDSLREWTLGNAWNRAEMRGLLIRALVVAAARKWSHDAKTARESR